MKNKKKNEKSVCFKTRFSPTALFFLCTAAQLLFSILYLISTGGNALLSIMPAQGADQFMDFFNHISYVREPGGVYFASPHACFPPLIYGMYGLFCRMLPQDATVMYDPFGTSTHALLLYVVYCVLLAVCFFYSVCRMLKNRTMEFSLAATVAVLLSYVFIFGVTERGNSVMIVCILLLLALELRDSGNVVHRELALLFIAIAAGIKIYPAVFGVLYIFEKRWKEAGRLLLYGIGCFFVPFAWFGGSAGMKQFFLNQRFVHGLDVARLGSVKMSWEKVAVLLRDHFAVQTDLSWVGTLLTVAFAVFLLLGVFFCKDRFRKILLLCGMMVVIPFWSGGYTFIYMCIPLIVFFRDAAEKKAGMDSYFYAGMFALLFSFFIYDRPLCGYLFGTNIAMAHAALAVYVMCTAAAVRAIFGWICERFKK